MFDTVDIDADPLTTARTALAALAERDPATLPAAELARVVTGLETLRRALDGVEARFLAELDRDGWTDTQCGHRTPAWLAAVAGLPRPVAATRVRVARTLVTHYPHVADALTAGRVGFDHARALVNVTNARNRAALAAAQQALVDDAAGTVFEAWHATLVELARLTDPDGPHPDDPERNHLAISPLPDGTVRLDGTLAGTAAEATRQAIETRADEIFRRYQADQQTDPTLTVPSRAALRAQALIELTTGTQPPEVAPTEDTADPAAMPLRLPPAANPRAGRPEITLVAQTDQPISLMTPDGRHLTDALAEAISCDAHWHPIVVDSLGVPLAAGRTVRHATHAQRRALATRDGGCTFPGCSVTPDWCDAHHIRHWSAGGTTDLANLALLCRHHHTVTHRKGWTATIDPTGHTTWTTPTGATLHGQRHHRQRAPAA